MGGHWEFSRDLQVEPSAGLFLAGYPWKGASIFLRAYLCQLFSGLFKEKPKGQPPLVGGSSHFDTCPCVFLALKHKYTILCLGYVWYNSDAQWAIVKKGSLFLLVEFKGKPFQKS